jgi:hypothetical protein
MLKISKRAAPLLVLTIIMLSMVSIMLPVHADIAIDGVFDQESPFDEFTSGDQSDDRSLNGTGVTAGVEVKLYWDAVKDWDGEKGFLNSTEADADGSFDIWFEVPGAVNGTHYLWVKDPETGDTASYPFEVFPKTSCPTTALHKDKVEIKGYGFDDEKKLCAMLITGTAPVGVGVTGENIDSGDGTEVEFDGELDNLPVVIGSVIITDGVETFTDDGVGDLDGSLGGDGTIDYVSGDWEVEFNTAPANGQGITANYEYFDDSDDTLYIFSKTIDTDEVGSWKKNVEIPKETVMDFGQYNVYAYDDSGNIDWDDLKIGAGIELEYDEGPTGSVVEITGEGFDPDDTIVQGEIFMRDGTTTEDCYIIDAPVDVQADGDIKLEVVIPSVDDWDDYDELHILTQRTDLTWDSDDEDFDIVGDAEIVVKPEHGQPGDEIEIWFYNCSQITDDDEEVTLELWNEAMTTMEYEIDEFEVEDDGTYYGTFDVPAVGPGDYYLIARQFDEDGVFMNINTMVSEGEQEFKVGFLFVDLSDDDGPCGTEVTLRGTGLTPNGDWNATMGGVTIFEDEPVDSDGDIVGIFFVPTLDEGEYEVIVTDVETEIEILSDFEVDNSTFIILDPEAAPNEYNVSIEGYYFSATDDLGLRPDLEFEIYNETEEWKMDVLQFSGTLERDAELNENGNFTAWWEVPDDEELSEGVYTINVTDDEDLIAQHEFILGSEHQTISPRKSTFLIGEIVAFDIESSFEEDDSYIDIWDPDGNLIWKTDFFDDAVENMWIKVDSMRIVPYASQNAGGNPMVLLEDSPLGTWKWKWYEEDDDEIESGTFNVAAAAEAVLQERIGDLEDAIGGLSGDVSDLSGDVSDLSGDVSGLKTDVSGLSSELDTKIGEVADDLEKTVDDAVSEGMAGVDSKIGAVEQKVGETDTKVSGLSTLVYGAIGASLIAALAAIVSLMQISRRIAG